MKSEKINKKNKLILTCSANFQLYTMAGGDIRLLDQID